MDINTQILDVVLRKYAKSDKELYTSLENVSEEEFKEILKTLKLSEYTKRDSFFWELQLLVEKSVAEHGGSDDNERLAEMVVNQWNEKSELKINQSLVLSFIYLINLKFPNSRKAFISICDGDLQSYKTFNNKPRLFNDMLVRYLICVYGKQQINLISRTVEQVMSSLFNDFSNSAFRESFARLGFQGKKGLNFGKMNAYRKTVGVNDLVYAEGMKTILLTLLEATEVNEVLNSLKQRLTVPEIEDQDQDNSNGYFGENLLIDNNPPNSFTKEKEVYSADGAVEGINTVTVKKENSSPVKSLIDEKSDDEGIGEVDTKEEVSVQKEEHKNEVVVALENALCSVQTAILKASEQLNTKNLASNEPNQSQLKLAEEEISRLKLALQQEKERVDLAEERAFAKVLNAIGGESSNYLLSDLFEESQGKVPSNPNISAGRLINLFSSLGLSIGLEEHSNNQEIGNVFSVHKDELIKKYRIDGPVDSLSDEIQVRLLKYGWIINGKVVVQPLVAEVKEEM